MSVLFPDSMPKGPRIKPGGISQYFDQPFWSGKVTEFYASTCNHCGHPTDKIESLKRLMDHVELCFGCMKLICLDCRGKMQRGESGCVPQEMECERIEREDRLKRKLETTAWGCY